MVLWDFVTSIADKILSYDVDTERLIKRLDGSKQEMELVLHDLSGRIKTEDYAPYIQKYTDIILDTERELKRINVFHRTERDKLSCELSLFRSKKIDFVNHIEHHNDRFLKDALTKAYSLIGNVEGRKLDEQQMTAIVKDAHSHLVLAGAGTGKTTTIVGKVKYLLSSGMYKPEEILMISFTKAAVNEMQSRLVKETNAKIYVATFHKLGYDIIKESTQMAPDVFSGNMNRMISDKLKEMVSNPMYSSLMKQYILFHRITPKSELLFTNEAEYLEYLECNPPLTILEKPVKSYGELEIANYLTLHGIAYEYESSYRFDTADANYRQYHPDFYLPEYDIYIEYFAVDRNNTPPKHFTPGYVDGIKWKRELHRNNGTKMIECYAYEQMEGILRKNLEERLRDNDVITTELSFEEIIARTGDSKSSILSSLSEVIGKVISLAKNRRLSSQQLMESTYARLPDQMPLLGLVIPVMDSYEKYLRENKQIDFTDMVNMAVDLVREGRYGRRFRYVIIDEYQDITASQYMLMRALRDQHDYELFCVGDDWQSIYRFAGSDIGYILNFGQYWGSSDISRIETTYRFSQRLVDISSEFVMNNPYQYVKCMRSGLNTEQYVIGNI